METSNENQKPGQSRPSLHEQRSNTLSIKSYDKEPNEYKLSEINDSGVYLPPSPPEKKSFWGKSPHSTVSSNHRSMLSENEPFSISRESFDSYRRSFDISARSPVPSSDALPTRASLQIDSRPSRLYRSAVNSKTFQKPERELTPEPENEFEDVGLNDETNKPVKKKGFLSRFGDNTTTGLNTSATPPSTSDGPKSGHFGFHLTGRKRGQSGVGSELGNFERPASSKENKDDGIIR